MQINLDQLKEEETARLLTVGDYEFEIISAEKKPNDKSSDGEMTKLVLAVFDEQGRKRKVKSNVAQWKNGGAARMKAFFESVGLDYKEKHETEDLIGLTGVFHSKHGEFNGKPQDEVNWWVPQLPGTVKLAKTAVNKETRYDMNGNEIEVFSKAQDVPDDDLPF